MIKGFYEARKPNKGVSTEITLYDKNGKGIIVHRGDDLWKSLVENGWISYINDDGIISPFISKEDAEKWLENNGYTKDAEESWIWLDENEWAVELKGYPFDDDEGEGFIKDFVDRGADIDAPMASMARADQIKEAFTIRESREDGRQFTRRDMDVELVHIRQKKFKNLVKELFPHSGVDVVDVESVDKNLATVTYEGDLSDRMIDHLFDSIVRMSTRYGLTEHRFNDWYRDDDDIMEKKRVVFFSNKKGIEPRLKRLQRIGDHYRNLKPERM